MKVLLLGAGHRVKPKINTDFTPWNKEAEIITLDFNPATKPHIIHDLNNLKIPLESNTFDEIHAYEVLEHVGTQGDWQFFFKQFAEFHRLLKTGGFMIFSCPDPNDMWAWGDPGHTRVIGPQTVSFLDQAHYNQCDGPDSPCTDYRPWYKVNFTNINCMKKSCSIFYVMQAF